jgi:hypothetical protein
MPANRYIGPEYITAPLPAIAMGKTGEPEVLAAAGAVSLLTEPTQFSIAQGSDQAMTLADGDETQRKLLYMTLRTTNDAVVTPVNLTGGTTITFNATTDWSELRFLNGSWVQVAGTATVA